MTIGERNEWLRDHVGQQLRIPELKGELRLIHGRYAFAVEGGYIFLADSDLPKLEEVNTPDPALIERAESLLVVLEKATPGPWAFDGRDIYSESVSSTAGYFTNLIIAELPQRPEKPLNAEAIVALRNDAQAIITALLAALRGNP